MFNSPRCGRAFRMAFLMSQALLVGCMPDPSGLGSSPSSAAAPLSTPVSAPLSNPVPASFSPAPTSAPSAGPLSPIGSQPAPTTPAAASSPEVQQLVQQIDAIDQQLAALEQQGVQPSDPRFAQLQAQADPLLAKYKQLTGQDLQ